MLARVLYMLSGMATMLLAAAVYSRAEAHVTALWVFNSVAFFVSAYKLEKR